MNEKFRHYVFSNCVSFVDRLNNSLVQKGKIGEVKLFSSFQILYIFNTVFKVLTILVKMKQGFQNSFYEHKAKYSNVKHTLVFISTYQRHRVPGTVDKRTLILLIAFRTVSELDKLMPHHDAVENSTFLCLYPQRTSCR